MAVTWRLDVGHRTEAGPRPENQDAVLHVALDDGRVLVAVADGMGGLGSGARASRVALERLEAGVTLGWGLDDAIQDAHEAVRHVGGDEASGSTVVAALVGPSGTRVAHVGDSRAYQFGPMGLVPLTRDHTVAADAEARGELAAREVAGSRWGGTLSRSLGRDGPLEVAMLELPPLAPGGWLVLTSDGVHGVLDDGALASALTEAGSAPEAASALVARALDAGAQDNVAAVVVRRDGVEDLESGTEDPPEAVLPGAPRSRGTAWDPGALVSRSHNPSPRRRWRGPGILASLVMVALVLLLLLLLL